MSPESLLHAKYSTKSDVWSFGVTIVEIWTQDRPYPTYPMLKVVLRTRTLNYKYISILPFLFRLLVIIEIINQLNSKFQYPATFVDPCNQYSNNCSQCLQNGCGFCLTSPQFSNYSICSNKSNQVINSTCTTPQLLNGNWITSGSTCPSKIKVFFKKKYQILV